MKFKISQLPYIFFLIILLVFFYLLLIERNPSKVPSALLDKNVPIFEAESLFEDKKFLSSEIFDDQIILVNFFATWCKPCKDEHVYIKSFANEEKVKVIGINYKDNPKLATEWLKNSGNPYSNIALDKKGKIAIEWGVYGIPETFLVNSKGVIKYRHVGQITKKIYKKINQKISEITLNE